MLGLLFSDLLALIAFMALLSRVSSKTAFYGYIATFAIMTVLVGTTTVAMVPGIFITAVIAFAICFADNAGILA